MPITEITVRECKNVNFLPILQFLTETQKIQNAVIITLWLKWLVITSKLAYNTGVKSFIGPDCSNVFLLKIVFCFN